MESMKGKVVVVTGASRGAGRGIASVLGEAGATVYVTGRSVRGNLTKPALSGTTIEDTAALVTARGAPEFLSVWTILSMRRWSLCTSR